MNEDKELICRILEGDVQSFSSLVNKYYSRIYSFLYKMNISREDAEDLAQEVFIKVYNNLYKYDDRWNFSTWIFRVAINTLKDFRKRKGIKTEELTESHAAIESQSPEAYMENRAQHEMIAKMFNALNEETRTMMVLRYFHGFSLKEIGEICKTSPDAVKMKIFRGRSKLSKLYGEGKLGGESYEM